LLGALLGQGPNSELLTQEQQKALRQQQLMALSASLLQAGGPSPVRTSLGQAIGQGLMSAQQAGQQGTNDALQAMLVKSQIEKSSQQQNRNHVIGNALVDDTGKVVYQGSALDNTFGRVNPGDYTPASLAKFSQSGDWKDLERVWAPVNPTVQQIGGVPTVVQPSRTGAPPTQSPLSTAEAEAEAKRRQAEAAAAGQAGGQITGAREGKRGPAYAAFQTGIASLESAMGNTATGPLMGRMPALTAAQQTAEGAEATMAPILKQLFRDAGEGTFTDSDQALLMKMVPTRKDHPEARKAKIEMIDNIVRAKLAIGDEPVTPATIGVGQSTEINGVRVKRVK
jgi:hypothetical protein